MKRVALQFGRFTLFVHSDDPDMDELLTEARHRGKPLTGPYSAIRHKAHTPVGQDHLHVYKKQNEIFAINQDSSGHDASHRVGIPNAAAKAIRQQYPNWILPANNFIENIDDPHRIALLMEGTTVQEILQPLDFDDWLLL